MPSCNTGAGLLYFRGVLSMNNVWVEIMNFPFFCCKFCHYHNSVQRVKYSKWEQIVIKKLIFVCSVTLKAITPYFSDKDPKTEAQYKRKWSSPI